MKENTAIPTTKPATKHGPGRIHSSSIRAIALAVGLLAAVGFTVYTTLADPPVLTITPLGGNQFNITVTNATGSNFLLEWTPVFADTNYPWLAVATNVSGQTNFMMDASAWPKGFFRVLAGDGDVDGDGIPAWMDAQPLDPSIGALRVTIDSPTNGASIY